MNLLDSISSKPTTDPLGRPWLARRSRTSCTRSAGTKIAPPPSASPQGTLICDTLAPILVAQVAKQPPIVRLVPQNQGRDSRQHQQRHARTQPHALRPVQRRQALPPQRPGRRRRGGGRGGSCATADILLSNATVPAADRAWRPLFGYAAALLAG